MTRFANKFLNFFTSFCTHLNDNTCPRSQPDRCMSIHRPDHCTRQLTSMVLTHTHRYLVHKRRHTLVLVILNVRTNFSISVSTLFTHLSGSVVILFTHLFDAAVAVSTHLFGSVLPCSRLHMHTRTPCPCPPLFRHSNRISVGARSRLRLRKPYNAYI